MHFGPENNNFHGSHRHAKEISGDFDDASRGEPRETSPGVYYASAHANTRPSATLIHIFPQVPTEKKKNSTVHNRERLFCTVWSFFLDQVSIFMCYGNVTNYFNNS
jgi:hypothetical protein